MCDILYIDFVFLCTYYLAHFCLRIEELILLSLNYIASG